MFEFRVQGDPYPDILSEIERFKRRLDLFDVTKQIRDVILEDNTTARLAGIDADGLATLPLSPATLADPRRGPGPPLVPREVSSRAISNFEVDIQREGGTNDNSYRIEAGWPSFPQIQFHVTGYLHHGGSVVPARNPMGIRPEAMVRIEDLFDSYCQSAVEG